MKLCFPHVYTWVPKEPPNLSWLHTLPCLYVSLPATCLFDEHHAKPLWELPGSTLGSEARKLTLSRRGSCWRSYIITRSKFNKVAPARFIRWLVDMMAINLSIICQLCTQTEYISSQLQLVIMICLAKYVDLGIGVAWYYFLKSSNMMAICVYKSVGGRFWLFDEIFCCELPCPGYSGQHLGVLGASIA